MSDQLRDFFVSIGFVVDETSRKQAVQKAARTQAEVTKAADEAGQQRMDREAFRQELLAKGNDLSKVRLVETEKKTATAVAKVQKDSADRVAKIESEALKKSFERRTANFKDLSKGAIQIEAVMSRVAGLAGVVGGALVGSSFLQNIMGAAGNYAAAAQQSMRTGASVRGVQGLLYGFAQLGVSREESNNSFESFRKALDSNPGLKFLLQGAGVNTDQSNDRIFAESGRYFDSLPYNVALAKAGEFGISENTLRALQNPALAGKIAEGDGKASQFGLDPDKAAADAKAMTAAYDRLSTDLGIIKDRTESQFFKPMTAGFNKISDWLETHQDSVTKFSDAMAGLAAVLSARLLVPLGRVVGYLTGLSGALSSMPAWLLALIGADAAAHPLNKNEPQVGRDGSLTVPGGPTIPGSIFDPSAQAGRLAAGDGIALPRSESRAGRLWRQRPTWLGGEGKGGARERLGQVKASANMTLENAAALSATAKDLGTTPEDLATVIAYETGGTFSPSIWGGKGGNYMGLIQFGGPERQTYGANDRQTFPEQMQAVARYLKDRGYKPGMGLADLYSTINAGRPGRYGASDGNGTVMDHVARMQREQGARVKAFLDMANKPALASLPDARDLIAGRSLRNMDLAAFKLPTAMLAPSPASMYQSYDNSRGDSNFTQNVTVQGVQDPDAVASHIKLSARRGGQDYIRMMQGATQ